MKKYEKPVLTVELIENLDVITALDNFVDDPDWGMTFTIE